MRLDLQSVEKVAFSTFAWAFAPKVFQISLARLRMSRVYPELFLASPGAQLQEITLSLYHRKTWFASFHHFFDPTGSNTITIPDRIDKVFVFDPMDDCNRIWPSWIEKVLTVIPFSTGPREKREIALDTSWRKLRLILTRGRLFSKIFGAKAQKRTCWKVLYQRAADLAA